MSERQQREEAILAAARLLPPELRSPYLDQLCREDRELRRAIEKRLAPEVPHPPPEATADSRDQTLLETTTPIEGEGARLGRYRLLQKLGEGGCGIVYMAEQEEPVRRRVALKVIKLGMDTHSVIARFEAERQALAMMDHPNIARVLDAGATETGRPFFVMELVRGVKITDYCDQNKLPMEQRLELFCQVCHAIQHAHQKGVIHRDIKPSNILVTLHDGVPIPKVIDFGIAKATDQRLTDKTLFTRFEQFIGTPAYMSPEQAEMSGLDVDTRSDIYSLGVLLYELLTGKTPFDAKELLQSGLDEMRRTIREREPERPSTRLSTMLEGELTTTAMRRRAEPPKLVSLIRGDLDWISLKALEKDRTRRYDTANALAGDIQRYLNNEPVLACPPSSLYRFQKMVRRNKAAFVGIGAVALTLILGFALSLYLFVQEREARQRAVAAEKEQARLRSRAEAAAALEAKMRETAQLGEKYSRAGLLLSQGDYDGAEALMREIPAAPPGIPIFRVLGIVHAQRGEWPLALNDFVNVLTMLRRDSTSYQQFAPEAYHSLAPLLVQTGDLSGYRTLCDQILREFGHTTDPVIAERMAKDCLMLPPPSSDLETLQHMADTAVGAGPSHKSWVYFEFVKGLAEYRQGHFTEAIQWLEKVVPAPGDSKRTVQARMVLAMARFQLKQTELARAALAEGLEFAQVNLHELRRGQADELWNDWIIAQVLVREAKGLIESATARP